jgi:glycosyltransferase involved in cell wall biosynthesis
VHVVVAITPNEAADLGRWISKKKISVIANPIRKHFNFEERAGSSTRPDSNFYSDSYVLTVGRNDYNKNITAVSKLTDLLKLKGYRSVIVTNKSDGISKYCIVELDCEDQELLKLIKGAKFVIIPSRYEAFSLVAIEALSLGIPVICRSNVGALSFKCVREGAAISDFSEASFLDCLNDVSFNKKRMADISVRVRARFSPERYSDEWVVILSSECAIYDF